MGRTTQRTAVSCRAFAIMINGARGKHGGCHPQNADARLLDEISDEIDSASCTHESPFLLMRLVLRTRTIQQAPNIHPRSFLSGVVELLLWWSAGLLVPYRRELISGRL